MDLTHTRFLTRNRNFLSKARILQPVLQTGSGTLRSAQRELHAQLLASRAPPTAIGMRSRPATRRQPIELNTRRCPPGALEKRGLEFRCGAMSIDALQTQITLDSSRCSTMIPAPVQRPRIAVRVIFDLTLNLTLGLPGR